MRSSLVVALFVALGLAARGPAAILTDQDGPPVQGAAGCLQDFPSAAVPDPRATVMMCGLDNPRGLAFSGPALFVAEAGRGGLDFPVADRICFRGQAGGNRCFGSTGAISRLWSGVQERVATGFPSHAGGSGQNAIGPNDIAFIPGPDPDLDPSNAMTLRTAPEAAPTSRSVCSSLQPFAIWSSTASASSPTSPNSRG